MSWLKAAIFIPVACVVVLFALANRAPVTVSFDPLSRDAPAFVMSMPLFVLVFACVMAGVALGGIATWFEQGKHRKAARDIQREARRLRGEADALKASAEVASAGASARYAALAPPRSGGPA